MTKTSRTWERERNRDELHKRPRLGEPNISPLSTVLRNMPPTRLTSRSTFFFCCGAVHMDVKLDNNAESAKAYSDCRKTPTRSDVILIAFVPNELKDVKIFALRDFVTDAHVWRSDFPQSPSLSFSYCFVSLRVWSSLFAAPRLVGGERKMKKCKLNPEYNSH